MLFQKILHLFYMQQQKINTLFILLLLTSLSLFVQAKNYYVSSTIGSDSYSFTQAQNQATPWRSLAKANAIFSSLLPGDSILFKRGDVFFGSLVATSSGNISKKIVIGAYGAGNKPLFSGFYTLRSWTDNGNGVWQIQSTAAKVGLNVFTINNNLQALGRYPNANDVNGGYLNYETFNGTSSFTDNQLTGTPNWAGADVVMRKVRWILDICKITSHSGSTISYTNPVTVNTYAGKTNFGYFIQNDPKTLDSFGEWYFDKATKTLQVYYGDDVPANYTNKISVVDSVINLGDNSYITLDNIAVEGANVYGIYAKNGSNISIQNCDINNCGDYGMYVWNTPNTLIENNGIRNIFNNGIYVYNEIATPTTITNNTAKNIGMYPGMGESGDNTYNGIFVNGNSLLVEYNRVDSTGYNAIEFQGNDVLIKNNFVTNFCNYKDDGGGIYTYANNNNAEVPNRIIKNNIVLNTKGAPYGTDRLTPEDARGIYMDGGTTSINVIDNSVANCVGAGLYFSCTQDIHSTGNTVFNTIAGVSMKRFPLQQQIRNLTIKNNIFFPLTATQNNLFYWNGSLNYPTTTAIEADIRAIGILDSNYYRDDVNIPFEYYYHLTSGGTFIDPPPLNLSGWKTLMQQEANSKVIPAIPTYKINSTIVGNTVTNNQFASNISGFNFWSSNNGFTASWDNTSKITGTGSLKITPTSLTDVFTTFYAPVGAVNASKKYVLRFKTLGSNVNGVIKAYIRKSGSPYNNLVPSQLHYYGATIKTHEFLFNAPTTDADASFLIEVQQMGGTTYIDDIEFIEVSADYLDINSQVRFEYNETKTSKVITLGALYKGVDGIQYNGTITLAPFTSKILIRDTGSIVAPLVASINNTTIKCFGGTATLTITATGGYAPYTGTGTFTVTAGTYSYTVKDAVGTSKIITVTIVQPSSPLQGAATVGTIAVAGGTTSVTISATGGTSPYTGTGTFTVTAGTYTYTVTDANSCTNVITVIVTQPSVLAATITANNIACNGGTTTITVAATGGTAPYTGTGTFTVAAGTYTYTVKDANNVTTSNSITITQPANALAINIAAGTIVTNGGTTTLTVTASGGTSPYTGIGTFTVSAGSYTYTVTDAKGCTKAASVTVTQPTSSFSALATGGSVNCYGTATAINVTASGGTTPYTGTGTYNVTVGRGALKINVNTTVTTSNAYVLNYWRVGAINASKSYVLRFSTVSTIASNTVRASIRQTLTPYANLIAAQTSTYGTGKTDHQFIFNNPTSDAAGSFLIEIAQQAGTTYIDNIGFFEATNTGQLLSANLYVNGSFENDITSLTTWSFNNNHTTEWDSTGKINATHFFKVTDALGKISTAAVNTNQPLAPLTATVTATAISVNGGTSTVNITATGGTAPYIGVGTFNVFAGAQSFTITDANGCAITKSITITQPNALSVVPKYGVINCYGASTGVTFVVAGGAAPYSGNTPTTIEAGKGALKIAINSTVSSAYQLNYSAIGEVSNTKNYTLRFTTTSTLSNGMLRAAIRQTLSPYSNITAYQTRTYGTAKTNHEITFIAPNSEAAASFIIEIPQNAGTTYIDNIAFFESTSTGTLVGINKYTNGDFETGINGITTYSYNNNHTATWDTTKQMGRVYYFTISDTNGATNTAVVEAVEPLSPLVVNVNAGTIASFGGSTTVTVIATGGSAPYTGTGTFTTTAGTYNYVVTDAFGCQVTKSITVTQPINLVSNATSAGIKCFGSTANVTVSAVGGTAPYTGTGNFVISAGKGSYKVEVNSTVGSAFVLNYWTVGAISATKNYVLRFSTTSTNTTNTLRAAIRQTLSPYANLTSYQTSNYGTDRADHEFLFTAPTASSAASFIIEIPQNAGITYIDNIAFFEATTTRTLVGSNLFVNGDFETGIGNITTYSYNNNHTVSWDTMNKMARTYYFTVTDNDGATATAIINATQPLSPLVATSVAPAITVTGGTTTIKVTASGGTAPYTGTGNFIVTAGKYTYTVTDANGCTATTTFKTVQTGIKPLQTAGKPLALNNKELIVEAYPNPSNATFTIQMQGGTAEPLHIAIIAYDGRVVYNKAGNVNETFIVGKEFVTGLYTVKVLQGNTVKIVKLIKL